MNNVEFQPPNPIKPYEEWDIPTANLMKPDEQCRIPTSKPYQTLWRMGLFQLQTLWNLMNNVEFQPPNPIKPYEEWDIPTANLMKPDEQSGIPTGNPIKPYTQMGLFQLRALWNPMNNVEFQLDTLPYEEWDYSNCKPYET